MQRAYSLAYKTEVPLDLSTTFTPPEYTVKEICIAIPSHCFYPHTLRSLSYALRDFDFAITLVFVAARTNPVYLGSLHPNPRMDNMHVAPRPGHHRILDVSSRMRFMGH